MTLAASFLGGAASRLLPASVPFRFFGSATAFHALMWPVLFFGADQATGFRGGFGPVLAGVHLLTLGVLTTTAIGASAQLLPVATRRALAAVWPVKVVFWLTVPGMSVLFLGMFRSDLVVTISAGIVTAVGLLLFAGLLADNLRRAGSLPVVAAYGWAALLCLLLLVIFGLLLAVDYEFGFLPDHNAIAVAHLILGGFGFMGLLALGFSHVLVPMFALASSPPKIPSWLGFVLAVGAIILGSGGALLDSRIVLSAAALLGVAAAAVHLWLMHHALTTGMRKRLGLSFLLIRSSWMLLLATPLVGLAALYGYLGPTGPTLFGFLLLGGWLLTFLLGILQRILPFLASMHASRVAGSLPRMSELAASAPLKLHAACHGLALILMAAAIVANSILLAQVGCVIGFVGALAFAAFAADVLRRIFLTR
jgi:hypothetical protein